MQAQIGRANHIVVPSEFCREEMIRFFRIPERHVTVTPLAVHEQFRKPPSSRSDRRATLARLGIRQPYLLYVGGYESHKNVGGLLKVFAGVRWIRSDLSLVLVGTKSVPENIQGQAAELGLHPGSDVRFLLNLTDDLTDVYDAAELFISLSWRETFCLPALEALTRGLPVVASAWGATPEVVGDAARLVDPRDSRQAIQEVVQLLSLTDRVGVVAKARLVANQFDWTHTARQTRKLYERLAG
jgi:glycosyltransferase involved in cell wall biosynthesis